MTTRTLRLGIDVGGTHTDGVLLDSRDQLQHAYKTRTTPDPTDGIRAALRQTIQQSGVAPEDVGAVMLGTTHCANAIVERRGLARVGFLRIGKPATLGVRPLRALPDDVRHAIGDCSAVVAGGHEYDGREIAPLDEGEVRRAAEVMRERRVQATAICSVFSPVRADHEQHAAEICREVLGPDVPLTLSHEIGSIGLLERENAACLNAAVANVAAAAIQALRRAAADAGLHHAKLYLTQNDGTLMSTDYALRFPVRTIACGPTNSIRGATFLTAERDAIIVDIGGTTTLVGVSLRGFPRESAVAVEIGGVRTNFRMPDLLAVGCGGGTVVHVKNGKAKLGPESTGYELVHRGLSWGGDTLTTTDVALAAGYAQVDDPACQPHRLSHVDPQLVPQIVALISQTVRDAVDRMRTNPEPMPMILVGGGGIILSPASYDRIKGVARVIRPTHFQYANAVGAAIAQVSGEVDRLFALDQVSRDDALRQAKEMARQEAVKAGANAGTVEIVEVDEVPLAYLPGNAIRIRVKAVGALVS